MSSTTSDTPDQLISDVMTGFPTLIERFQALTSVISRIRESLDLETIFKTTVTEVRQLLQADRVAVFRFDPTQDWAGEFVSEDVAPEFDSALTAAVYDHCFGGQFAEQYSVGRIQAVADIYEAGLSECHVQILGQFQVRANLVVPKPIREHRSFELLHLRLRLRRAGKSFKQTDVNSDLDCAIEATVLEQRNGRVLD